MRKIFIMRDTQFTIFISFRLSKYEKIEIEKKKPSFRPQPNKLLLTITKVIFYKLINRKYNSL